MEYVTLNNGIKMPSVGYGVFQIPDEAECIEAVKNAIEVGYRLIDTAQAYGNEVAVGKAIKQSLVSREELFITTKVWVSNAGYEKAKQSILDSLQKLDLDYIDLMLIHQPINDYYGTYKAMEELYKEGKLKAIGVSNFYPDRLADITLFNEITPAVNQIEVNPFHQQIEAQKTNDKYDVKIQAWAPFAEGQHDIFNHPDLVAIGEKYNKSAAQVILRWLMQRNIVPLAKTVTKERMEQNIDVFNFSLTNEDMQKIANLDRMESSFFNHREVASVERLAGLVR